MLSSFLENIKEAQAAKDVAKLKGLTPDYDLLFNTEALRKGKNNPIYFQCLI